MDLRVLGFGSYNSLGSLFEGRLPECECNLLGCVAKVWKIGFECSDYLFSGASRVNTEFSLGARMRLDLNVSHDSSESVAYACMTDDSGVKCPAFRGLIKYVTHGLLSIWADSINLSDACCSWIL